MADQKSRRGAERVTARPQPEPIESESIAQKETDPMTATTQKLASAQPAEGITVTGEAVRRVSPETAEFLIEITSTAPTAAQALRDNQAKFTQVAQSMHTLGVQGHDIHTISQNVLNTFSPVMQPLAGYNLPQIGQASIPGMGLAVPMQPDLQFGSYQARNVVRVYVRDIPRAGDVLDAAARAGGVVTAAFQIRTGDEANARRSVLEAAGKDARSKAEALAAAAGKQLGDAIAISEELIATNGTYTALRNAMPLAFGPGAPQAAGELEYYARVSASFRLQ